MNLKKMLINSASLLAIGSAGYFIGRKTAKKKVEYAGSLWVDDSEPNAEPALYLELHTDVENVRRAKAIQLKVMHKK